jgi:hypothetical protein
MNLLEELKEVVSIKIEINEEKIAEKLFNQAVDPLLLKLVDIIPTEFDNVLYASKKEELRVLFTELLKAEIVKLEEKIDEAI